MSEDRIPEDSGQERKLTKREAGRLRHFDGLCDSMAREGWSRRDLTIDLEDSAPQMLLLTLFPAVVAVALFVLARPENPLEIPLLGAGAFADIAILCLGTLLLTVVHELIHGLFWGIFAPSHFKAIEFGIILEMLTPYCTCAEPLTRRQYVVGALAPTAILGVTLTALACMAGSMEILILDIIMIFGGGGDALIIRKLLEHGRSVGQRAAEGESVTVVYLDHPVEPGLVVFERENNAVTRQ